MPKFQALITDYALPDVEIERRILAEGDCGLVVADQALATALQKGQLAGDGLDVQQKEPCDLTQPPFNDQRVIVTPHAAFVSEESLADLRTRVAKQVVDRL